MITLSGFQIYLSGHLYIDLSYETTEETNALNTSEKLINIFYEIDDNFKETTSYEDIIYEQGFYLLENNPYEETATTYQKLNSVNIGGAINATVNYNTFINYISPLSNAILKKYGYFNVINEPNSTFKGTWGIF